MPKIYLLHFLRIFLLSILALSISPLVQAQQEAEKEEFELTSPYHTIYGFLANLQADNFRPQIAAKTLSAYGYKQKRKEQLAIKLIQILDGKGLLVDIESLPKEANYKDSTQKAGNQNRYVLFESMPDIYLEKVGDMWLFSRHTVRKIDALHAQVYPYGLDQLLELIPQGANQKFLGLTTWQYIGILILLVLTFVLHKLLTFFFKNLLLRFFSKVGREDVGSRLVKPVARPASLFILFYILIGIIPVLQLPVSIAKYLLLFMNISLPVFAIVILTRFIDFVSVYMERAAERTEGTLDDQLIPLLRKTAKILVSVVGIIFILQYLEFNITALLTGISIGGLAFALAAQDTIKNLFGSLTIFLDRPFQVGDWIVAPGGIDGSIEEVGFRSTRVRTFYNSLIYIPNGKLADMTIDNMGMRRYRRFRTTLGLTYDTPPELIEAFVQGLRQIIQTHPDTRKDYYHVYLNNFNAASLDVLFYTFFEVPDWAGELRARHEVMLKILKLADHIGVRFAFPTQTIHIEDLPGQQSLTPQYNDEDLSSPQLKQKVEHFVAHSFEQYERKELRRGQDSGINEGDGGGE